MIGMKLKTVPSSGSKSVEQQQEKIEQFHGAFSQVSVPKNSVPWPLTVFDPDVYSFCNTLTAATADRCWDDVSCLPRVLVCNLKTSEAHLIQCLWQSVVAWRMMNVWFYTEVIKWVKSWRKCDYDSNKYAENTTLLPLIAVHSSDTHEQQWYMLQCLFGILHTDVITTLFQVVCK